MEWKGEDAISQVRRYENTSSQNSPSFLVQELTMDSLLHSIYFLVATQITSGRIVRIAGGVPAVADVEILKTGGLLEAMLPGEKGLADKGYVDAAINDRIIVPFKGSYLTQDEKLFNRCCSAVRITVERTNGLIKGFNVMRHAFRHGIIFHNLVFHVVCNLVNLRIRIQPLVKTPHRLLQGLPVNYDLSRNI
jgi:hypothetical protein